MMGTIGIICIIIAFIGAIIYDVKNDVEIPIGVWIVIFGVFGTALLIQQRVEKHTAIDCLKGKNPYKMEIRYELKDSIYVPKDTIYVKIEVK